MSFRKFIVFFLCICLILPVLSGCGILTPAPEDTTTAPAPDTDAPKPDVDGKVYTVGVDTLPYTQEQLYQQLFDLNNKLEIDLDMPTEEIHQLQADYDHYSSFGSKSPIYRKSDVNITLTTADGTVTYHIPEVGVRMKGNTSRRSFYDPEQGVYNFIHFRLDFQETFDDEIYYGDDVRVWETDELRQQRKDRTFATLEKLELRWNKCYDSTYLKEHYAYQVYRSEGVLAPHTNLTSLDWSGLHLGVYLLVEPVDEIFLQRNLPEAEWGGDLYKCGLLYTGANLTGLNSIGIENEDNGEFYVYDLKTNKKTSQHEALTRFITQLNSGTMAKEDFTQLLDMDYFMSYAAVSYFLGNPDDLRHNCNNYYLYFTASSNRALIIPYDYDRCLGVTVHYNPSGHAMTQDDPFSDECLGTQNGAVPQQNPLYLNTIVKGGAYVREFADVLNRVSGNQLLTMRSFEQQFNTAKKLYAGDVQPQKNMQNADGRNFSFDLNRTDAASGFDNMSFSDYMTAKMAAFREYMTHVEEYANYDRPEPVRYYIRGDFNDWSNQAEYAMTREGELWVYTLSFGRNVSFKVYDDLNQWWYGTEFLDENTTAEYTTNDHANIILSPGTYYVTFDPANEIVTLTKK